MQKLSALIRPEPTRPKTTQQPQLQQQQPAQQVYEACDPTGPTALLALQSGRTSRVDDVGRRKQTRWMVVRLFNQDARTVVGGTAAKHEHTTGLSHDPISIVCSPSVPLGGVGGGGPDKTETDILFFVFAANIGLCDLWCGSRFGNTARRYMMMSKSRRASEREREREGSSSSVVVLVEHGPDRRKTWTARCSAAVECGHRSHPRVKHKQAALLRASASFPRPLRPLLGLRTSS